MTQAMCSSFKMELFRAMHDFRVGGHQFRIALYTGQISMGAFITHYAPAGEVVGIGYAAGGFFLTNVDSSMAGTAGVQTFAADPTWLNATFTASQALIYNATMGNRAIAVLDFGGSQSVVGGAFIIHLPPLTVETALLRLI